MNFFFLLSFDQLRDQLKEKDEELHYNYDNTTSTECNNAMKGLEENRLIGFLWNQMKPFIRGKILYTPDTPATRKVVGMVNDTFRPIEEIRKLTQSWVDSYSEPVKGFFMDKENQQVMKELFTDDQVLDFFLTNNITKALNEQGDSPLIDNDEFKAQLREYFAGNFSERWEETFDTIDTFMKNVSVYLSCFDFNKFVPTPTEHDLEVEGIKLISENKLWAGLVFLGIDEDAEELPKFVRYKIRLDSDKVDTTRYIEDRLPRPGPRRRPGIDLKYLYYGFAYLQVII